MQAGKPDPLAIDEGAAAALKRILDVPTHTGMAGLRLIRIAAVFPVLRTIGLNDQRDAASTSFIDWLRALLAGSLVKLGAGTGGRQRLTLRIGSAKARTCQISVRVFLDRSSTEQAVAIKRDHCPVRVGHETPWIVAQRSRGTLRGQTIRIISECLLGKPLPRVSGNRTGEIGRGGYLAVRKARTGDEGLTAGSPTRLKPCASN